MRWKGVFCPPLILGSCSGGLCLAQPPAVIPIANRSYRLSLPTPHPYSSLTAPLGFGLICPFSYLFCSIRSSYTPPKHPLRSLLVHRLSISPTYYFSVPPTKNPGLGGAVV
ncbi:hypothetical protein BDW74DRAFT_12432 [Aspergillus multicolor]|uniref:uncharacterized protein n=1 Tax=Aspergillus multicolor TaxID=41759 RepID=UPI003CCD81E2